MRSTNNRREAIQKLGKILDDSNSLVDVIIVEGLRDIKAVKRLGYSGEIVASSKIGVNDYDLMCMVSRKGHRVLILTDFDQEGTILYNKFSSILEHEGVVVEKGLRKKVGKLTAALGVYAIEDLDNMMDNFEYQI